MRFATTVSASVFALTLAATAATVSASEQSAPPEAVTATPTASDEFVSSQFATLRGVKAVPMASGELEAVKGLDIHFAIVSPDSVCGQFGGADCIPVFPNAPADAAPPLVNGFIHLVNHKGNNFGGGQAPPGTGPGYSGLCGSALKSPAIWIPGQSPTTGTGGGC